MIIIHCHEPLHFIKLSQGSLKQKERMNQENLGQRLGFSFYAIIEMTFKNQATRANQF